MARTAPFLPQRDPEHIILAELILAGGENLLDLDAGFFAGQFKLDCDGSNGIGHYHPTLKRIVAKK